MIQNDVIMLESVVEYCNRVNSNSRLVVIKYKTACLKSILGVLLNIYKTVVYHFADIKYDTE